VVVEQQMLEEEIVVNKPKRSRKKKSDEPEGISIYHSHKHEEYTSDCQEPEEIIPEPKFERFRPRNKKKLVYIAGLIALSLILVSGFWYVGFGILPKATIDVSTKKSPLDFEENVLMDKSISQYDVTKRIIPAELLTFKESQTGEFNATGKGVGGAKAKGVITVYNNYGTMPQILVATTRLETSDGKIFRLDSRTVIPGGTMKEGKLVPGSIDVNVTSDQGGTDYNIGPSKFTIPGFKGTSKYDKFYGESKNSMIGGSSSDAKVVTQDDLKNAEKVLGDQLFSVFNTDVQSKLQSGFKQLDSAKITKIDPIQTDVKIGATQEKFKITMSGQMKVLVFSETILKQMIEEILKPSLIENTEFYKEPQIEYQAVKTDFDKGIMQIKVKASYAAHFKLNSADIIKDIKGQTSDNAKVVLQQNPAIDSAKILLWPAWVNRIPVNTNKIQIRVD